MSNEFEAATKDAQNCVIPANLVCLKKRSFEFVYDNGSTPGSVSNDCNERANLVYYNQSFTSQGWETGAGVVGNAESIGPYSNWGPQLQDWVLFGTQNDPYNSQHAYGVRPAPTWRSWEIRGCNPEAQYGAWTLKRADNCIFTVFPTLYKETIERVWVNNTQDCFGNPLSKYYVQNADGETYTEIATPADVECFVSCDYIFPNVILEGAVSECLTREILNICDKLADGTKVPVAIVIDDCAGKRSRSFYTLDSYTSAQSPDDYVDYIKQGVFVDCDTEVVFVEPPIECESFVLKDFFTMDGAALNGQLLNREWQGTAPAGDVFADPVAATIAGREIRVAHDFNLPMSNTGPQTSLALNDTDNAAAELSIQVLDGFIEVKKSGWYRYSGGSEGYWAVELGECCGPLNLLVENGGFFPTREMVFYLPKGIHQIRIWNIDTAGSNSSATFGYSDDGGLTYINDNTPPSISFGNEKIHERCLTAKVCTDTGAVFDFFTDQTIDKATLYTCSRVCPPNTSNESTPMTTTATGENANVTPFVKSFVNSNTVQTLGVAAGTKGRIVSVEDTGGGLVYWTIDGSTPSATNGFTTTGPYHASYDLKNVSLDLVRLIGSAGSSDYSVAYEIYN